MSILNSGEHVIIRMKRVLKKLSITFLILFFWHSICYAAIENSPKYAALVIDQKSKKILYQKHAKAKRYPASLVKVMTAYLVFEALEQGKVTMDTKFKVSKHAASQEPVSLYLKPGQSITVRDALNALIVKSANDVSVTIAEGLANTEANFAKKMTAKGKQLGLTATNFTNSSGLPDPKQYTNAVDMVKMTMAVKKDFPQYFYIFGQTEFMFRGKLIKGHNKVLAQYPAATGLKTGLTNASGRNLITTTSSSIGDLVAVVFGADHCSQRDSHMITLLDMGYNKLMDASYQASNKKYGVNIYNAAATGTTYTNSLFDSYDIKYRGFKPIDVSKFAYDSVARPSQNSLAFDVVQGESISPFAVLQNKAY